MGLAPPPKATGNAKTASSHRALSEKIRKSIAGDKALSDDAQGVKVTAQSGKVTLSGTVTSKITKGNIFATATAIAGDGNVTNKMEVAHGGGDLTFHPFARH